MVVVDAGWVGGVRLIGMTVVELSSNGIHYIPSD